MNKLSVFVIAAFAVFSLSAGRPTDVWSGRETHLAVVNPPVPTADGSVLSLRGTWEFASFRHALEARDLRHYRDKNFWGKESAVWKDVRTIEVPGCWEAQGVGKPGVGISNNCKPGVFGIELRHAHVGNGFYRKRVTIPSAWVGKRIWLKVGRAQTWAWAWIDDKPVTHFSEAHRALKWDVTDLVTPGRSCVVKFQVDNSYVGFRNTGILSYHRWGGLVRDVELEATPMGPYIDDAWARGDFDRQEAEVHVELNGVEFASSRLKVTVEGETVEQAIEQSKNPNDQAVLKVPLRNFRAWSPEHPNLYTAKVELVSNGQVAQTRFERFGVRKLEVRGKEFFLNGKPFYVRGFGDDHTYPITGMSPAAKDFHLAHLKMARAAGFNFVRTHTHCEIPEYFDAADEAGIFVQPELSYNCDESSVETFPYDPIGDAEAIWQTCRRHPSFAVYSGGNEGTHGPNGGKALYEWVRTHDPDRLVVEQDGGTYFEGHRADTSDYASGPMAMWERGSFNQRAFVCHEYANLAVKGDARMEDDYTGIWKPRLTRTQRRENLAPAGLGDAWGDRLQDAQHAFQRLWAVRSVEAARKDPFCDGYIFWTIVDYTHWHDKAKAPNCQGLWDPFWRVKPQGTTIADMAAVNSPDGIYLDTENRERVFREETDPMLFCSGSRKLVIDETNRVFTAGETIPAQFILSHYGEADLSAAELAWRLTADGMEAVSGSLRLSKQARGPARTVAKAEVRVPAVAHPVKARLEVSVGGVIRNGWDFWLFPKCVRPDLPERVAVVDFGSAEAEAARKEGKNLLLVGNRKGERDIFPGWWGLNWRPSGLTQNGVAVLSHAVFGDFPHEPFLSPLLFRIIGQGTALPVAGFEEKDFVMIGEGIADFKLYLAAKVRPDGGREVFVSGLDLWSETPEGLSLYANIVNWLNENLTEGK